LVLNALYLLVGVGLLALGGEALIRGALSAANRFGVSPLLSGLVIVGFGTSMPEMVVSIEAAIGGQPDIAIGNVVGSNIANILLILGLCAVISPLAVTSVALRRDSAMVVAASVLFIVLAGTGNLSHLDAAVLLLSLVAYLAWAYWSERFSATPAPSAVVHQAEADEVTLVPKSAGWSALAIVIGLVLLIAGSKVLIQGAVGLARGFGVSEAVIGLTLVAVGTSLPELTISVIATLRRHGDVAVGNVLGSNIFNLLGILGVSALMQPLEVRGRIMEFDQWVMLGVAVLLPAFLYTGRRLNRTEGGILLVGYAAYVGVSFFARG
jgi:cation:H+ antiporter